MTSVLTIRLPEFSFQRIEEKAYQAGQGKVPVQRFGDFKENQITTAYGKVHSCIKGASVFGNVRAIFPTEIAQSLEDGITAMDHKIHGFADDDALLSGVESPNFFPCKELKGMRTLSVLPVLDLSMW